MTIRGRKMKIHQKNYLLALILGLFVAELHPMAQALQSPAGRALMAKKKALEQIKKSRQLSSSTIWIRTKDNQLIPLAQWKIDEMDLFKNLLNNQKGMNGQSNPLFINIFTKADIELLSTAFDNIAAGTFDQYYSLEPEYKKSLTDKTVGSGTLRTVIALAGTAEAKVLSAFLASYFLPTDMQRFLMVPQIIDPVITYLKNEILRKNKWYQTILTGHEGPMIDILFSENNEVVATAAEGEHNNIILWDAHTGKKLQTITSTLGDIETLAINNDGSKIAASLTKTFEMPQLFNDQPNGKNLTQKEIVVLWNGKTGRIIKTLENLPDERANRIEFTKDGKNIIVEIDHEVPVPDNAQPAVKSFVMIIDSNNGAIIATHTLEGNQFSYVINPKHNTFIAQSENALTLYDSTTGKMIKKLEGPPDIVYAEYSSDGNKIIAYDNQAQTIFIWDGVTGEQHTTFADIAANKVVLNQDGTKVAVAQMDGNIAIWGIAEHAKLITINNENTLFSLLFSPDGKIIAANDMTTNTISLWNSIDGNLLRSFPNQHPEGGYVDLNFSDTGLRMRSHSDLSEEDTEKHRVNLWETATGKKINSFADKHTSSEINTEFTTVVATDQNNSNNLVLWKSLSEEECRAFEKIEKDLSIKQAQLLYQLYMGTQSKAPVSVVAAAEFKLLPSDIQKVGQPLLQGPSSTAPKMVMPGTPPAAIIDTRPPARLPLMLMPKKPVETPSVQKIDAPLIQKPQPTWREWVTSWW
jgi:WD40 repeat protein